MKVKISSQSLNLIVNTPELYLGIPHIENHCLRNIGPIGAVADFAQKRKKILTFAPIITMCVLYPAFHKFYSDWPLYSTHLHNLTRAIEKSLPSTLK